MPGPPRTVVADDREIVRVGLVELLRRAVTVVAAVPSRQLVEAVRRTAPRLLVVGVPGSAPDPFRAIAAARIVHDLRVLVVADTPTLVDLREAIIAGVDSLLVVGASGAELRRAALATAAGERVLASELAVELANLRGHGQDPGALDLREIEVLQLLADGLTNQEIAERLGVAPRTVKTYVQHLMTKLGASDRTQAVAQGLRLGLIR